MTDDMLINLLLAGLGIATHILKQMVQEVREGYPPNLTWIAAYFSRSWPQTILSAIGTVSLFVIAFALEDLNAMSAWLAGFSGNSASEILGSRRMAARNAVTPPDESGPDR